MPVLSAKGRGVPLGWLPRGNGNRDISILHRRIVSFYKANQRQDGETETSGHMLQGIRQGKNTKHKPVPQNQKTLNINPMSSAEWAFTSDAGRKNSTTLLARSDSFRIEIPFPVRLWFQDWLQIGRRMPEGLFHQNEKFFHFHFYWNIDRSSAILSVKSFRQN